MRSRERLIRRRAPRTVALLGAAAAVAAFDCGGRDITTTALAVPGEAGTGPDAVYLALELHSALDGIEEALPPVGGPFYVYLADAEPRRLVPLAVVDDGVTRPVTPTHALFPYPADGVPDELRLEYGAPPAGRAAEVEALWADPPPEGLVGEAAGRGVATALRRAAGVVATLPLRDAASHRDGWTGVVGGIHPADSLAVCTGDRPAPCRAGVPVERAFVLVRFEWRARYALDSPARPKTLAPCAKPVGCRGPLDIDTARLREWEDVLRELRSALRPADYAAERYLIETANWARQIASVERVDDDRRKAIAVRRAWERAVTDVPAVDPTDPRVRRADRLAATAWARFEAAFGHALYERFRAIERGPATPSLDERVRDLRGIDWLLSAEARTSAYTDDIVVDVERALLARGPKPIGLQPPLAEEAAELLRRLLAGDLNCAQCRVEWAERLVGYCAARAGRIVFAGLHAPAEAAERFAAVPVDSLPVDTVLSLSMTSRDGRRTACDRHRVRWAVADGSDVARVEGDSLLRTLRPGRARVVAVREWARARPTAALGGTADTVSSEIYVVPRVDSLRIVRIGDQVLVDGGEVDLALEAFRDGVRLPDLPIPPQDVHWTVNGRPVPTDGAGHAIRVRATDAPKIAVHAHVEGSRLRDDYTETVQRVDGVLITDVAAQLVVGATDTARVVVRSTKGTEVPGPLPVRWTSLDPTVVGVPSPVDRSLARAELRTLRPGAATVRARVAEHSGEWPLRVVPRVSTIRIDGPARTVVGKDVRLAARPLDPDGIPIADGIEVEWHVLGQLPARGAPAEGGRRYRVAFASPGSADLMAIVRQPGRAPVRRTHTVAVEPALAGLDLGVPDSLILTAGEERLLDVTPRVEGIPERASDVLLRYCTSDPGVADAAEGVLRAVGEGFAWVRIESVLQPRHRRTLAVRVRPAPVAAAAATDSAAARTTDADAAPADAAPVLPADSMAFAAAPAPAAAEFACRG